MLAKSVILGIVAALMPVLQAAPTDNVVDAANLAARGGGLNIAAACHQQYGDQWSPAHNGNGKFDWYCIYSVNSATGGVDHTAHCQRTYGPGSAARNHKSGIYDWYCT